MREKFDLIIIGAGPIGLACAIEAAKAKLKYVVVEKGCLVNSIYHYPTNMTFFSTSEKLEIGGVPFISHGAKPVRSEALEYYRRVAVQWNLKLRLYCKIKQVNKIGKEFHVETDSDIIIADALIVATGFYDLPNKMNIPGESLGKVHHYYKDPHPYFKKNVIVVGAANSAIDAALETYRKGANVSLIIREDKISERVKYWVKPDIENRILEGSIKAYFNSRLISVSSSEVMIESDNKHFSIPNDFVIAMTGYVPDFTFLESLGIILSDTGAKTPIYNPKTMESNIENIYLAGVICGGLNTHQLFIENSREHADLIVRDIISKSGQLT